MVRLELSKDKIVMTLSEDNLFDIMWALMQFYDQDDCSALYDNLKREYDLISIST